MTFAGRYGFPNLVLGAIDVDADVKYGDYQYRTGVAMSSRSRFETVAFGALDDSVFDFRILFDWLQRERGAEQIGVTGLSLGGFTTAMLARNSATPVTSVVMPISFARNERRLRTRTRDSVPVRRDR